MFEFTGGSVPTLADLQDRLEQQTGPTPDGTNWLNWVVRASDEVVGVTQATVKEHGAMAEVAWEIGVPWQGRGYASEAATVVVDWMIAQGVPDIRAHIHPDHAASAGVARAAGLEPTDGWIGGEVIWRIPAPRAGA
jgi:RimJ/RimL family protein N-acetyltransferase